MPGGSRWRATTTTTYGERSPMSTTSGTHGRLRRRRHDRADLDRADARRRRPVPGPRARRRHRPSRRPARQAGGSRSHRRRRRHEPGDARPLSVDATPTASSRRPRGDMVTGLPDGPFDLVVRRLQHAVQPHRSAERAGRCFRAVADRLRPGGRFVVEAFVPDDPARDGDDVSIRTMTADRVVLSISRQDRRPSRRAEGQFVEFTEAGGVRLRPWSIRYADPAQLDATGGRAGLELESRWADMARTPFDADADRHVTVYRRPRHDPATPDRFDPTERR